MCDQRHVTVIPARVPQLHKTAKNVTILKEIGRKKEEKKHCGFVMFCADSCRVYICTLVNQGVESLYTHSPSKFPNIQN